MNFSALSSEFSSTLDYTLHLHHEYKSITCLYETGYCWFW